MAVSPHQYQDILYAIKGVFLLNLKSPSQELQNSIQGLGMIMRSHFGMAPAYMVVLNMLNIRWRAAMYSRLCWGISLCRQPSLASYSMEATPETEERLRDAVLVQITKE